MVESVRLAKRVAELVPCSRSEAERYIEGGWVRVDGQRVELPQFQVGDQKVELDPEARLTPVLPVTLLLHKPPGFGWSDEGRPAFDLLRASNRWKSDRSGVRQLERHMRQSSCVTPLELAASGLLVFSQDASAQRKLREDAALLENELIVEVRGDVTPEALHRLNRAPVVDGRAMLPVKVSVTSTGEGRTGLRFALKGGIPGQIARMCDDAQLSILSMKRIRIGRVPMAALPPGQWRYLLPGERF